MVRRPIIWGLIFLGIGAVGWVFSVVLAVVTFGKLSWLANVFAAVAYIGFPVALVAEIISKIKKRT